MTTETKKTAAELYEEFVSVNGTDVAAMSAETSAEFVKLLTAKRREEKASAPKEGKRTQKIGVDKVEYLELCEKHGINPSDKFAGWVDVEKLGAKDKETGVASVVLHQVGVKFYETVGEDKELTTILVNISPSKYNAEKVVETKVRTIKLLASA